MLDQRVDLILSVAQVATLDEMLEFSCPESSRRVAEFEWPQEVACLFEIRSDGKDLVDQILHAHNTVLAQVVLDQLIVGERNTLFVDFAVAALVNELADGLEVWVTISDVRFDDFEHLASGFCEPNEDTTVDLNEAQQLENLAGLRSNFVDTVGREVSIAVQPRA